MLDTLIMRIKSQFFSQTAVVLAGAIALAGCSPQEAPTSNAGVQQPTPEALPYKRINTPNPNDPLDAHIFELDNGLQVYLTENHEEPRFYAEIAVKAGSKHDPADATGLAHYLEHLLFKGNQSLGTLDYAAEKPYLDQISELYEQHFNETDPEVRADIYAQINELAGQAAQYAVPNEIDKLYNSMGATGLNAHTWHEETVYKVGLPSNRLEQWAAVESNRFIDPVFRLFHTELETVYEEKNRSMDNRGRVSYYALGDLLYKVHPYGQQTTIGSAEHLKNPSLVYIHEYFDTYYVPNNMAIFISGDIDIDETISVISDAFGKWEEKPVPEVGPWVEEPLQGAERVTVNYPGEEEVQIAFRTVPNGHEDKEALMLVDMILDNRTAGLINLNLNQAQAVQAAGSSPEFLNDYGSQRLWGIPKADQTLEEVEALLLEQIELVKAGEFDEWILPAIVNDFKKTQKQALESNTARVTTMRQAFMAEQDWDFHIGEIARLEQVDKEDVIAVANKYFSNNYAAVYRVDGPQDIPTVEKPQIDPVQIDPTRQSQFAAQILAMPYEEIEPTYVQEGEDYRIVEFAPGVDLYYAPNPLNDLFSFSINVEVGTEENELLNLATSLLEKSGTQTFSATQLQKEWYRLGSEFGVGAGANESTIGVSGLDEQFEATLALMLDLIRNPQADEATLEELKAIILKAREEQKQDPRAISRALYLYNRYGDESPMLQGLSSDDIRAATLDDIQSLIHELLGYKHTISYTGSLPIERVVEILREQYQLPEQLMDTPPYRFRTSREITENEIYVVDQQTAQSQVRIEFPDGTYDESITVPVSLFNTYFGTSMSSVVFQELREARALAYSAQAQYVQGSRLNAENLGLGVIGSQNDKTVEAIGAFLDLYDNMPVSEERFSEAKNSMENRYRTSTIGFRRILSTVRSWEDLGLEGDPRQRRFAELQETGLEDMVNFQRSNIAGKPRLISIVGDVSLINADALSEYGQVKQVQVDDIFVD
ncbi:MAG: insulinase family protein [Pseudohongiellaceae bacterium]|nr:insulinase family protein [Pseudohongiellaceae bacterium]